MIHHYFLDLEPEEADLRLCLLSGQVFRFQEVRPGEIVGAEGDRAYRLVLEPGGAMVQSTHPPEALRSLLRLEADRTQILEELKRRAPEMAPCLAALPGLRLLRPSSPVEVFLSFLCSANNNLHRIMPMVRSLAQRGELLADGPWGDQRSFPSLAPIAELDPEELRREGFGYRAPLIVGAARHALDRGGEDWLARLSAGPYESAKEELMAVRGLGAKLADCICLFGLGHLQAVPVDVHVWKAACAAWFPEWEGKSVTSARTEALGRLFRERFGDLAGWAQQFLYSGNLVVKRKDLRASPSCPSSPSS